MDEEQLRPEPKISDIEALYIGCILVIVSIANLIPFVGDFTSVIAGGLMAFYLYSKGLTGTSVIATNGVGYACGFIPILQMIPTELLAWIFTVFLDRHPKLEAIAEKVGELEGAVEGAPGGETGAVPAEGAAPSAGGAATSETGTTMTAEEGPAAMEAGEAGTMETGTVQSESAGAAAGGGAAKTSGEGTGEEGEFGGEGEAAEPNVAPEALGEQRELLGTEGQEGEIERELFKETPAMGQPAPVKRGRITKKGDRR